MVNNPKVFDMSSSEPHIVVHCPVCGDYWQQKVDDIDHVSECGCKLQYKMIKTEGGLVDVEFTVPNSMINKIKK